MHFGNGILGSHHCADCDSSGGASFNSPTPVRSRVTFSLVNLRSAFPHSIAVHTAVYCMLWVVLLRHVDIGRFEWDRGDVPPSQH